MLSILVNAYACSPEMGSEPGMAWNWCVHLAKHCELHIITEGEFRDKIEAAVPTLPQGKNMHFYYNPVSEKVRKMCWNQGDWRFYFHYAKWQKRTLEIAKRIMKENHIDLIHQLNMIGFREPGRLWKIKEAPLVWGPVDAKERMPLPYLKGAQLSQRLFFRIKNKITGLQLRFSHRVRNMVENASIVISAQSESRLTFKKYFGVDSPLLNETGCTNYEGLSKNKSNKKSFDLLWVGKMDFRKQLGLALQVISEVNNKAIRLHIVGNGDNSHYKQLATELEIDSQCIWHGAISHEEVQELMRNSDILFFTSVAEGTPHVVMEALANNLPVVCFNTCGQGDSVNDSVGRKVSLNTPAQSIKEFAEIIKSLSNKRELVQQLSNNCRQRQAELSWDSKALQMVGLYEKAIQNHSKK